MKKRFQITYKATPLILLLACILAYGLLIPWLGFYWDDLPYTWFAHILGSAAFPHAFAGDRPLLSLIYMVTTPLLGAHPFAWQIFGILTRWSTAWALWWVLGKIWPRNPAQNTWVSLLFVVFPGFSQQWISVIYSQAFLILLAFLLSLGWMLQSLRNRQKYILLTVLALLGSLFSLVSTEYFFGLELLRPLFIFIILKEQYPQVRKRLKWTFFKWLPYLVTLVGFSIWRFFLTQSNAYSGYQLAVLDWLKLGVLLQKGLQGIADAVITSGISAWTQTLKLFSNPLNIKTVVYALILLAASFVIFLLLLINQHRNTTIDSAPIQDTWAKQAIPIGLIAILLGRFPSWAAGLPTTLEFPWDRFMLSMMLGATLLTVGVIDYLIKTEKRRITIISLLLALSISAQFQTANSYRRDWTNLREILWQITWRMPGIEPNTILFTHETSLVYYSDYSLTATLNWVYAPTYTGRVVMPYLLAYTNARFKISLPNFPPNLPVRKDYRATVFEGNTSDSLAFFIPTPGCLRVMDPIYTNRDTLGVLPKNLIPVVALSDLSRIHTNATSPVPPRSVFGAEPAHTWCYYFENADLARQIGDWNQVLTLESQAKSLGYEPSQLGEWLPFLEAYLRTGNLARAEEITNNIIKQDVHFINGPCQTWKRSASQEAATQELKSKTFQITQKLQCP